MGTVKFRFFTIWRELEGKEGRRISAQELADAVGVNRNTINTLAKDPQAVRLDTLGKLAEYFRGRGMDLEVGDFFAEER